MIYIWCNQRRPRDKRFTKLVQRKPRPRSTHIERDVPMGFVAICGTKMEFNRFSYQRDDGGYPICKNCLRSCVDEMVAA